MSATEIFDEENDNDDDESDKGNNGESPETVDDGDSGGNGFGKCAICLENMEDDQTMNMLRCQHNFHRECILHWFEISGKQRCPICRTDLNGDQTGEVESRETRLILSPRRGDMLTYENGEVDLAAIEPLFGSFTTDEGDNIFVYESPIGIIMIRTMNVPLALIPTTAQGTTRFISLPPPRQVYNNFERTAMGRTRRFLTRFRDRLRELTRRIRDCFLPRWNPP